MEPNLPTLLKRVDTFRRLIEVLGHVAVVWRFDSLMLTENIDIDVLLDKVAKIGNALKGYAEKFVFSFADIASCKKKSGAILAEQG